MPDRLRLEPLHIDGLADYHCHCEYSFDAVGSIGEYCRAALDRNLAELCFTTHYDLSGHPDGTPSSANFIRVGGELKPVHLDLLQPYFDEVRRAHEQFYPLGLSVRAGIEFGWFPGCEEDVLKLKERYEIDYLLCGLHDIDRVFIEKVMDRHTPEQLAEKYFAQLLAAARSGLFNTLAHLDYYRKFGEAFYGPAIRNVHRPYLDEVLSALNETDTALEVNTSAVRAGLVEYFPQMEIVNAARRAGVKVLYLGSDAHTPEHVGFDFEAAAAIVPPFVAGCED